MEKGLKRIFGYARVSSKSQCTDRQIDALLKHGVPNRDIYVDKASGKNFDRPKYQALKEQLHPGDVVVVLDLDRLGRNYQEMAREWQDITRDKSCEIQIINLPILSTLQDKSNLDTRFMADMVFSLLSYVADRERQSIRERQREGIEIAKNNNVKFGRPKIQKPKQFDFYYGKVRQGEITARKAMEQLGLKPNVYYGFVSDYKKEHGIV